MLISLSYSSKIQIFQCTTYVSIFLYKSVVIFILMSHPKDKRGKGHSYSIRRKILLLIMERVSWNKKDFVNLSWSVWLWFKKCVYGWVIVCLNVLVFSMHYQELVCVWLKPGSRALHILNGGSRFTWKLNKMPEF